MTVDVNSIDIQHLQTVYKVSGVQSVYTECGGKQHVPQSVDWYTKPLHQQVSACGLVHPANNRDPSIDKVSMWEQSNDLSIGKVSMWEQSSNLSTDKFRMCVRYKVPEFGCWEIKAESSQTTDTSPLSPPEGSDWSPW